MPENWRLPLTVAAAMTAASIEAAVVITENQSGHMQTRIYHDGAYYEVDAGQLVNGFDFARDRCLSINHEARVYFEGSCNASIKEMMDGLRSELERQQATLSTEEKQQLQAMVDAMSQAGDGGKIAFKRDGGGQVAGYEAEAYVITINDVSYSSIWVSPDLMAKIGKEFDLDTFRRWDRSIRQETAAIANPNGGRAEASDPMADAFDAIIARGYPVRVRPYPTADMMTMMVPPTFIDEMSDPSEVVSVEEKSDFQPTSMGPPKDYTRLPSWAAFLKADLETDGDDARD